MVNKKNIDCFRFQGVKEEVIGEGTHFMIPWIQNPIPFDIRASPKNVPSITGTLHCFLIIARIYNLFGDSFPPYRVIHHSNYYVGGGGEMPRKKL